MKRAVFSLLAVSTVMSAIGCARPGEMGWGVAYTEDERHRQIARNWDIEGKQIVDDIDHILLLRPMAHFTPWAIR